jgi:hypothetical protein
VIVAKLQGGHSNQLFQYATARCLAVRRGAEVRLDAHWFGSIAEGDTPRSYELDGYRFDQRLIQPERFDLADDWSRAGRRLRFPALKPRRRTLRRYRQEGHGFDPRVLDLPDDTYLEGWWQDERYFEEIRPLLLEELELRDPPTERDVDWLRLIRDGASVSMHVRRGDYVTNPAARAFHGVLEPSYYHAALARLIEVSSERRVTVFVFSDDLDWCRRELRFEHPTSYVDSGNTGAADMRLMKHCKHHIVANSSFSWWGAWLSDHPRKVVVAPVTWFADAQANVETEIVPASWVRV